MAAYRPTPSSLCGQATHSTGRTPSSISAPPRRGRRQLPSSTSPGLHPDAARWLANERRIKAFGLDTASIDYGQTKLFEVHQILCAADIVALENVAHLDRLPPTGALLFALPMKIKGSTGSPVRIAALLPG